MVLFLGFPGGLDDEESACNAGMEILPTTTTEGKKSVLRKLLLDFLLL